MSMDAAIGDLRRRLETLVGEFDQAFGHRYDLRRPYAHETLSLYRRLRMSVGRLLRRLGLRRERPLPPWVPVLKHLETTDGAVAISIWAIGTDRDTLRQACTAIEEQRAAQPVFAPVLITDRADFAFYSRLGWLVELVPTLAAPAADYSARKLRYLAWRYRDLPAFPVAVGLGADTSIPELIEALRLRPGHMTAAE